MRHDILRYPNSYRLLDLINEERAREVRAGGCSPDSLDWAMASALGWSPSSAGWTMRRLRRSELHLTHICIMSHDRSPAQLESDFADVARAAAAGGPPATALTTLLHIGDEHLVVLSGNDDKSVTVRRIDLGATRIARDFFHHDPTTSREIERGIDFAEDEIMRLGKPADVATTLWSTSPALQGLPAGREAAATLLVVREFMHHRDHASIIVVEPQQSLVDIPASA